MSWLVCVCVASDPLFLLQIVVACLYKVSRVKDVCLFCMCQRCVFVRLHLLNSVSYSTMLSSVVSGFEPCGHGSNTAARPAAMLERRERLICETRFLLSLSLFQSFRTQHVQMRAFLSRILGERSSSPIVLCNSITSTSSTTHLITYQSPHQARIKGLALA